MATSKPEIPRDIADDFALSWKGNNGRWAKKINQKVRYFGLSECPREAHRHYVEFLQSGIYQLPKEWAKARDKPGTKTAAPIRYSGDDIPTILAGTPLKRHPSLGTFYWTPPGRKQISFPSDPPKALAKYKRVVDGLPVHTTEGMTITELFLLFIDWCDKRVEAGKRSDQRVLRYEETLIVLQEFFGEGRIVDDIDACEWSRLLNERLIYYKNSTKRCAKSYTNDRLANLKNVLRWGSDPKRNYIREPEFEEDFHLFGEEEVMEEQEASKDQWTPEEIRQLLEHEKEHPVRVAAILLIINCGLGNKDVADLEFDDFEDGWLHMRRGKTKRPRKIPLWPETSTSLDEIMKTPEDIAKEHGFSLEDWVRVSHVAKWAGSQAVRCTAH